mmetsp:Transcript_44399/g.72461  ORF Transcript_44399/g.72461 Transcript_44399/m.72461 type:complete len:186 (-) Transcript_44399:68-625(-)
MCGIGRLNMRHVGSRNWLDEARGTQGGRWSMGKVTPSMVISCVVARGGAAMSSAAVPGTARGPGRAPVATSSAFISTGATTSAAPGSCAAPSTTTTATTAAASPPALSAAVLAGVVAGIVQIASTVETGKLLATKVLSCPKSLMRCRVAACLSKIYMPPHLQSGGLTPCCTAPNHIGIPALRLSQ